MALLPRLTSILWLLLALSIHVSAEDTSPEIPLEQKESTHIHDTDPIVNRVREIRNEAMRLNDQQEYQESIKLSREAIEMLYPRVFGTNTKQELYAKHGKKVGDLIHRKDSILLTQVLSDYGNILTRAGEYEEAIQVFQDTLKYTKHLFGASHPSYGLAMRCVADAYYDSKDFEKAIANYKKLLFHVKRGLGLQHEAYMESGRKIGQCYKNLGQLDKAAKVYKKLLFNVNALIEPPQSPIIFDQNDDEFPELSLFLIKPGVGELYLDLAYVQLHLHEVLQAEFAAQQAKSIFKKRDGATSLKYAFALNTISGIRMHEKDTPGAYKLLKRAHKIARKLYGDSHEIVKSSRENLERVEMVLRDEEQSSIHQEL